MLGEEDKNRLSGSTISNRRTYLRSVSWNDRSPSNPNPRQQHQQQSNSKTRSCLPPLLPLSISKRSVEEWPRAGSDDLGVWPQPPTPSGARTGGSSNKIPPENSDSERVFEFKKDKLAFFEKECSRISDHIYLGSDAVAKNREILRQNGITHVLNCVGFVCPEYFKGDLVYKTLWLQDSPSEDITSILYDVFDYFEDVREQGGRVFVHCCQGVSRSTSLVIAYLMWREGQSFEDAFQYVKGARGVTNPNMGFACQLLQCQKRVHAVPASPNSVLRMYRMAPHSPYDPLHLVPKLLNHPGVQGLDSRGAFIVHVPTAMYAWIGKNCNLVMSNTARTAASQVIRYERAQGPILNIKEGEEPPEFWDALASGHSLDGAGEKKEQGTLVLSAENKTVAAAALVVGVVGERKVDVYDMDFEIFHKALAGGVVPPFPLSGTGSETCLPARESGWGRLRRKLAEGIMKEFVSSSKLNCETTQSNGASDMNIDDAPKDEEEQEHLVSPSDFSSPTTSSTPCGSPDSFSCIPKDSPVTKSDIGKGMGPLPSPCGSPDSFSYYLSSSSPKLSSKSPSLSPSTSDYSSSFTFSPSSSNWSDFSYVSSQQPSPSGLESKDPYSAKNVEWIEQSCFLCKENIPSLAEAFSANNASRVANTCSPCRGISLSIAERRGSNPPPLMLLTSADKPPQAPRKLVRSWSFSLPELDDEMMEDADCNQFKGDCNKEELMLEADVSCEDYKFFSLPSNDDKTEKPANVTGPILYQWPTMNKVGMHCLGVLDSRSVYLMFVPEGSLAANNPNILFIWLGHDTSNKQLQSEGMISADTPNNNHFHYWETIGRNFLKQMGLPVDATVQIVRQGHEPEQFLNHLI